MTQDQPGKTPWTFEVHVRAVCVHCGYEFTQHGSRGYEHEINGLQHSDRQVMIDPMHVCRYLQIVEPDDE